jgi:hypothetical protein
MRPVRNVPVDEEAPEYGRRRSIDRRKSASGKNIMLRDAIRDRQQSAINRRLRVKEVVTLRVWSTLDSRHLCTNALRRLIDQKRHWCVDCV